MKTQKDSKLTIGLKSTVCVALIVWVPAALNGQETGPSLVDKNLGVRTVIANLDQPTSMAFIGANDILVLEKATGKVQRVINGALTATVLDLAVNSASERGLLGIALHPDFPANPGVYLYWTESTTGADSTDARRGSSWAIAWTVSSGTAPR